MTEIDFCLCGQSAKNSITMTITARYGNIYEREQWSDHKNSVALEIALSAHPRTVSSGHTLAQRRLLDGGDASLKVGPQAIIAKLNTRSDTIKSSNIHDDIHLF